MAKGRRGHGEGSIYQRESDGLWVSVVNLGWIDGKRKRKYIYGKTRKEVAEKLNEDLNRQQRGLPVETERQTVEQFLTRWLEDEVKPNREPGTYSRYEQIVRLHIVPDLGPTQVTKLTPQHVRQLLKRKEAAGASPQLTGYIKRVLGIALSRAMKWELVARNVATLVDTPKVEREEIVPWTREEALRFLDKAKDDPIGALFTVALALGLRKGEATGLTWDDVDFENGMIHVRYQLQLVKGEGLVRKRLKTKRSRRAIHLPQQVADALTAHQAKQAETRLLAGSRWQETGYVFTSTIGTPLYPSRVGSIFARIVKEADVPVRRFHDQRHFCATLLLAQGVPPRVVMGILGHSTIEMLMDRYGHVFEESRKEAAGIMEAALKATPKASEEAS